MRDWIEGLDAYSSSLLSLTQEDCDYLEVSRVSRRSSTSSPTTSRNLEVSYQNIQDANTHFLGGK